METEGSTAPATEVPGFEPLGFGNLLERVFKISWHNFKTFAAIVGILVIPATLLFYSSFLAFPWDLIPTGPEGGDIFAQTSGDDFPIGRFVPFGILFIVGLVISMIGGAASTGAAVRTAQLAHAGLPVDARSAIKAGLRRAHSLLWVTLVAAFLALLVFAFVLAPGVTPLVTSGWSEGTPNVDVTSVLLFLLMLVVALTVAGWLWLMWLLAPSVVMSEPERGTKALRRSYRLVKGKVFWIGAVVFVAFAAGWTLGSVFTIPSAFFPLSPLMPGIRGLVAAQLVLGILPMFIYVPLQSSVNALLYVDARVRKEGLTLEAFREELQSSLE